MVEIELSTLDLRYEGHRMRDRAGEARYMETNMGLVRGETLFEAYDEEADARGIRTLLKTTLRRAATSPDDTVFIFFAGHGGPEEDSSAQDADKIRKYLLAYDTETDNLGGSTIPMDEVARIISSLNADRVVFFLDACYSGAAGGRSMVAKGMRGAQLSEDFLTRMSQGRGRIIFTSSSPSEVSKEDDSLKHGFFTYNLLEGLKGKADINGDRAIDLDEISLYLNRTVPTQTEGAQHPVRKGEVEGQLIVGHVLDD